MRAAVAAARHGSNGELGLALMRADEAAAGLNGAGLVWLGWAELMLDRHAAVLPRLEQALPAARTHGTALTLARLLVVQAEALRVTGALARAAVVAEEASEAATAAGSTPLLALATAARCRVATWLGELRSARRLGEEAVAVAAPVGGRIAAAAAFALAEARFEAEVPLDAAALVAAAGGPGLPRVDVPGRAAWHELLTRAALYRGDLDDAAVWAGRSAAASDACNTATAAGFAAMAAAQLTAWRRDAAGALVHARTAVDMFDRAGRPVDGVRARMLAGLLLALTAAPVEASVVIGQAHRAALDCDAMIARTWCERGMGGARTAPAAHPAAHPKATVVTAGSLQLLTDRERQVSDLVAGGRTNRQIAAELVLSVKTIERHLARIFAKAGIRSRASLAALVAGGR